MPDSADSAPARDIVSTRDFPHAPAALYHAFADPTRLAQWWGPAGFTNEVHEFDFRPGGLWQLTMIAPDGTRFENRSRFVALVPPSRIEFLHEDPVHAFRMTLTFAPHAGGTRITWLMRFDDPAEAARVRPFIVPANEQNFDRLGAHLASHPFSGSL